jgi:hypothetical protein
MYKIKALGAGLSALSSQMGGEAFHNVQNQGLGCWIISPVESDDRQGVP